MIEIYHAVLFDTKMVACFQHKELANVFITIVKDELNRMGEYEASDTVRVIETVNDAKLRANLNISLRLDKQEIGRFSDPIQAKVFREIYRLLLVKRLNESLKFLDESNVN